MTFKKQYSREDFLKVISHEWQKTRTIGDKIQCSNNHVTQTLLQMPEVEFRWVKGGKIGTREWKLKNEELE